LKVSNPNKGVLKLNTKIVSMKQSKRKAKKNRKINGMSRKI